LLCYKKRYSAWLPRSKKAASIPWASHPAEAGERGLELSQPQGFKAVVGHGVEAQVADSEQCQRAVLVGNLRMMAERGLPLDGLQSEVERPAKRGQDRHPGRHRRPGAGP